jgi:hypothetical protein
VAGAIWRAATNTVAGVGDLVQRTEDDRTSRVLGGRSVERSGDAVCGLTWHVKTRSAGFLVEPQNQGRRFVTGLALKPAATVFSSLASKLVATVSPSLGLKIGSSGLVIWASKSPRRFLGLCLKTKWVSVYRLRHKTNGGRSAWDTRRDLAACFTWKQVWLEFPNLA